MNLQAWKSHRHPMKHFAKLLEQRGSSKGINALVNVQRLSNDLCAEKADKTVTPSFESALEELETQLFDSAVLKKGSHKPFIEILEEALGCL
jgi:hypothetical protein